MSAVLFLCTGNAARSVMAGAALGQLRPDLEIVTAGTLVVDGMPMSWRTRHALAAVGVPLPEHRSRQAHHRLLAEADLVIALAPEHVSWVRRTHPEAATRTATLRRLADHLPGSAEPLPDRIAGLALHRVELEEWEEVADPGGGEADVFADCARQIAELISVLAPRL